MGILLCRELNSGHTLLLKWTEREGRARFGNRHADSRPLQSVERGTDRLQPAALTVPARRAPKPARTTAPVNDVNVGVMFKLIVAASVPLPYQRSSTVRNKNTLVRPPQGYLLWDAAMSRGISPRVSSYGGPMWILSAVIVAANVIEVASYSCHEVKTAFQLRQVGPLSRVPETPGTGEEPSHDN